MPRHCFLLRYIAYLICLAQGVRATRIDLGSVSGQTEAMRAIHIVGSIITAIRHATTPGAVAPPSTPIDFDIAVAGPCGSIIVPKGTVHASPGPIPRRFP